MNFWDARHSSGRLNLPSDTSPVAWASGNAPRRPHAVQPSAHRRLSNSKIQGALTLDARLRRASSRAGAFTKSAGGLRHRGAPSPPAAVDRTIRLLSADSPRTLSPARSSNPLQGVDELRKHETLANFARHTTSISSVATSPRSTSCTSARNGASAFDPALLLVRDQSGGLPVSRFVGEAHVMGAVSLALDDAALARGEVSQALKSLSNDFERTFPLSHVSRPDASALVIKASTMVMRIQRAALQLEGTVTAALRLVKAGAAERESMIRTLIMEVRRRDEDVDADRQAVEALRVLHRADGAAARKERDASVAAMAVEVVRLEHKLCKLRAKLVEACAQPRIHTEPCTHLSLKPLSRLSLSLRSCPVHMCA
jgi:hypothetical protein